MALTKRDRIALVLAIILVPIMIFMLLRTHRELSMRKSGRVISVVAEPSAVTMPVVHPHTSYQGIRTDEPTSSTDTNIIAQQKKIAGELPVFNPFAPGVRTDVPKQNITADSSSGIFEVTGIMIAEHTKHRTAIINGVPVSIGEKVGEWKVVEISLRNVVLDNGSEKITVEVR